MRENKFRVYGASSTKDYNLRINRMVYFKLLDVEDGGWVNGVYEDGSSAPSIYLDKKDNVMRYIGRKDKKGKEIYEEDMLERPDMNDPWNKYCKRVIIKWNDEERQGYQDCGEYGGYTIPWDGWFDKAKIIGNTYENPKLLEGA